MNFLIFFYFFTFSANFSKIDIFHRSQFWALCNNKNEFSRGQREGDGGREGKEVGRGREGDGEGGRVEREGEVEREDKEVGKGGREIGREGGLERKGGRER